MAAAEQAVMLCGSLSGQQGAHEIITYVTQVSFEPPLARQATAIRQLAQQQPSYHIYVNSTYVQVHLFM